MFVRVRSAEGPKHEYFASVTEVAAHPNLYTVVDKEPVSVPAPVVYAKPAKQARRSVGKTDKESA